MTGRSADSAAPIEPTEAGERPPHGPERGWSWRILGRFHITGIFWYRFHAFIIRAVPEPLLGIFAVFFAVLFFVCLRRIRVAVAANLEAALGPCGFLERQRRIFRVIWSFGWCLNERTERLTTTRPFHIETEAIDRFYAVTHGPRGVILITAHIGNYEVGSMMPAQAEGRRVHLVREPEGDAEAQAFVKGVIDRFSERGFQEHFATGDPSLGVTLLDALRRGEIVALQGDRPRTGAPVIPVRLFGRPFELPHGPAALARVADVPLLPVFVLREGRRRYRIVFRPPIEVSRDVRREAALASAMGRVAEEIEGAIRREPYQWFCFRRLWP